MYGQSSIQMSSDSPPLRSARKQTPPRPPSPPPSPAQAIADAWKRESAESQEAWRRINARVRLRYTAPPRNDPKSKL
ncbi:hypothetical protein Hypma_007928 [Hypsizygus marmoreus]|uniref:Uncharacterized protein n=1 Tax=Hypsizygus marmoreus TaxID=39966 RepID=A0A369JTX6_HYPMA|nr:hypothetical protein Hypma_007928 [Hypsizygus marmoreus]